MSNPGRSSTRRTRTAIGVSAVGVVLAAAGVMGGVGFAKSSVTSAQAQYGKTTICHRTHSKKKPSVTITVANSALPAHLRHGDVLGACVTTTTTATTTTTTDTTTGTTTTSAASAPTSGPGNSGTHGNAGGNGNGGGHGHGKK